MRRLLLRTTAAVRDAAKPIGEAAVGGSTVGLLRTRRHFVAIKTANLFGPIARFIGSRLLGVSGQVQKQGLVVHVIAQRFTDLSTLLGKLKTESHDFH